MILDSIGNYKNNFMIPIALSGDRSYNKDNIRRYVLEGELDEAVRILKESKELDSGYPGLAAQYSRQLISIYETQADEKAYKEELQYYVFECPQHDLEHIEKLKAVCTEQEWERYREQILQSRNSYSILYPFMEAEGLYERMLECMQKDHLSSMWTNMKTC